jgi:hypothetical protein
MGERSKPDIRACCYYMLTSVRSTNHDCGGTKPFTFGLIARGRQSEGARGNVQFRRLSATSAFVRQS